MKEGKIWKLIEAPQVMNYLPHRYPFLFVDRILEVSAGIDKKGEIQQIGTKVIGLKNATINEPYFVGHFPNMPITPGVVLVETMAQVASFALLPWIKVDANMHVVDGFDLRLAGVDKARFRKPVMPGDSMKITCEVSKHRAPIWGFHCKVEVDSQLAAESEILASVSFNGKNKI